MIKDTKLPLTHLQDTAEIGQLRGDNLVKTSVRIPLRTHYAYQFHLTWTQFCSFSWKQHASGKMPVLRVRQCDKKYSCKAITTAQNYAFSISEKL